MNIQEIKKILAKNQTWAKKAYGQHFLVDQSVLDTIIEAADLKATDRVVEIGPGLGVLTERLIDKVWEVIAIEADSFLVKFLKNKYSKLCHPEERRISELVSDSSRHSSEILHSVQNDKKVDRLTIIEGDALQVIDSLEFKEKYLRRLPRPLEHRARNDKTEEGRDDPTSSPYAKASEGLRGAGTGGGYKVVANIPYSITSKLIRLFLENDYPPESMTLLVQKEVAQRIVATPGKMSLLALSVQYYAEARIIDIVKASSFWPAPKVESSIIKIVISPESKVQREKVGKLFRLARIGFSSKRKTLANNLSVGLKLDRSQVIAIIKSVGLKEKVRAQELSVENWETIVTSLESF